MTDVTLDISFSDGALRWLEARDETQVVIDLTYRKGRCTSAFCTTVPNIDLYIGRREGRYTFVPVASREGRVVHVAKPIIERAEERDVEVVIERRLLKGLDLRGIDPYELGL